MKQCSGCGIEDHSVYLVAYDNKIFYTCHWCNVNVYYPKYNKINEVIVEDKKLELKECF
jgi:hypothetical protein